MPKNVGLNDINVDAILHQNPCLQCLSEQQLWATLTLLLCKILSLSYPEDCNSITISEYARGFKGFSEKQKLQTITSIVLTIAISLDAVESEESLMNDIGCILCIPKADLISAVLSQILECRVRGFLLPTI